MAPSKMFRMLDEQEVRQNDKVMPLNSISKRTRKVRSVNRTTASTRLQTAKNCYKIMIVQRLTTKSQIA
jgi:hypothetical protein